MESKLFDSHRWSAIATNLPGRTDNEIKNFWNTHLKKKLIQMGFDPMTHRPRTDFSATLPQLIALANLRDLIIDGHPWDDRTARLRAEAVHAAGLQYFQYLLQSAAAMASNSHTNSLGTIATTDMESMSLLSPLHMLSFTSAPTTSIESIGGQSQISLLPDLQIPCSSFDQPMSNDTIQGWNSSLLSQGDPSSTPRTPLISLHSSLPPLTDITSASNAGDACSTSSCGGSVSPPSFWPELFLDDPFMAEFA